MTEAERCRIAKEIIRDILKPTCKANDKKCEIRKEIGEKILKEECRSGEAYTWHIAFLIKTGVTIKESDIEDIIKQTELKIEEYGTPKWNLKVIKHYFYQTPGPGLGLISERSFMVTPTLMRVYWWITFDIEASTSISRLAIKDFTAYIAMEIRKYEKVINVLDFCSIVSHD